MLVLALENYQQILGMIYCYRCKRCITYMLIFKQPLNKVDEKSENLQMIQTALIEREKKYLSFSLQNCWGVIFFYIKALL